MRGRPFDHPWKWRGGKRGGGGRARKWVGSGASCKAFNASEAKRGKLKWTTERNELGRFPPPFRLRLFHSQPLSSTFPVSPLYTVPFRARGTLGYNAHYCTKLIKIKSCLLVQKRCYERRDKSWSKCDRN